MNKLTLFDIENTLLNTSSRHRKSLSDAFKTVYGVDWDIDKNINIIRVDGMTDQLIMYKILSYNGINKRTIKAKMKDYIRVVIDNYQKSDIHDKVVILAGVKNLLEEISKKNILLGLVTGNIELLARQKLIKVNLNHYFPFGGFGTDPHTTRGDLVRLAIKKARDKYGFKFDGKNVFLFGDAIADMKAGKEGGAITIGITTGVFSEKDLKLAGADYVFPDLKDTDKILKILF